MQRGSTHILRLAIITMAGIVILLSALALPAIHSNWTAEFPSLTYLRYPVIVGIVATIIPFFIALFQAMKLLGYIDKDKVFSKAAVRALNKIKYSAAIVSAVYLLGMPIAYTVAQEEDAPGLILMALVVALAPLVVAVFIGVGQRLLESAIKLKSENDLTV